MLDDMSLTVGDKTYASDDVKRAVENGTNAYNTIKRQSSNWAKWPTWLTMLRIKVIGLIPSVNSPGPHGRYPNAMKRTRYWKALTLTILVKNQHVTVDLDNKKKLLLHKSFDW